MRKITLELRWPPPVTPGWTQEAFVGAWHPTAQLDLRLTREIDTAVLSRRAADNWCILGTQPTFGHANSLVHARTVEQATNGAVAAAFRGYLASPALHSWSGSKRFFEVQQCWPDRPNGIYAAAIINAHDHSLTLEVDAFGIAPLYWHTLDNGVVLFATNPRYLRLSEGKLEPHAMRSMLSRGTVLGDMSLVPGVSRVPAGSRIFFSRSGYVTNFWFSFDALPPGDEALSDLLLSTVERAFQTAMDRCLAVARDYSVVLPLSGGDDSRRFLGALLQRKVPFSAATVRVVGNNLRDTDAAFAAELARRYHFPHQIHGDDLTSEDYASSDSSYRLLLGTELSSSSWIMPLVESLPQTPIAVFDGVAGGIFGNDSVLVPLSVYELSGAQLDRDMIQFLLPDASDHIFVPERLAPLERVQERVLEVFQRLPLTQNRIALATLLTHTRREVGSPMHHLVPAGGLVMCPYLDLDYVVEALRLAPALKHKRSLQAMCLEHFQPQLYAMPSSKRNVESASTLRADFHHVRIHAKIKQMRREIGGQRLMSLYRHTLRFPYNYAALLSAPSHKIRMTTRWWLEPLLMLESERVRAASVWQVG